MKNLTKYFAFLLVVVVFSASSFAQQSSTATASTTATIVTPILITKATDMNFGNVASGASVGTVVLTPASARSTTGGVSATTAMGGTISAAAFTVTGQGSYTYAISLPVAAITLAGTTAGVTVGTFVSTPSGTGTLTAGTQTLQVGATLNLPVSVAAGSYTNAAGLSVTVNYN